MFFPEPKLIFVSWFLPWRLRNMNVTHHEMLKRCWIGDVESFCCLLTALHVVKAAPASRVLTHQCSPEGQPEDGWKRVQSDQRHWLSSSGSVIIPCPFCLGIILSDWKNDFITCIIGAVKSVTSQRGWEPKALSDLSMRLTECNTSLHMAQTTQSPNFKPPVSPLKITKNTPQ